MNYLINKTFDEIKVGDKAILIRNLRKKDIQLFAILSGDVNPAHLDVEFAKTDFFHVIVAHGMWTAALISALLGTKLPGPGTIYLSQQLQFHRPVLVGDKITITVTVIKKYVRKPILTLGCVCQNQHHKTVVSGVAKVLAPTKKVKRKPIKLPIVILKKRKKG